ncbi:MAG: DUF4806 domain-containing protein [Pyrinomonadaceae bacterium]
MATKKAKKPVLNFAAPIATVDTTVKLEEPISAQLVKYQDFIEKINGVRPSTDDIINRALDRVFSRDAAFKEFAGGNKGRTRSTSRGSEGD